MRCTVARYQMCFGPFFWATCLLVSMDVSFWKWNKFLWIFCQSWDSLKTVVSIFFLTIIHCHIRKQWKNIVKLYCLQSFSIQNVRSSPRIKFTRLWFVEAAIIRLRMLQMFMGYPYQSISSCHQKISMCSMATQCSRPYLRSLGEDLTVTSDITHGFLPRLNQLNMSIVLSCESSRKYEKKKSYELGALGALVGNQARQAFLYHGLS